VAPAVLSFMIYLKSLVMVFDGRYPIASFHEFRDQSLNQRGLPALGSPDNRDDGNHDPFLSERFHTTIAQQGSQLFGSLA
jgi:hypothetical protein